MKKTLQDQYLLIKEGKGHKGVFLTEAKRQFPNIVRNAATFDEAVASLKTKSIISENVIGLTTVAGYEPRKKESYETAFESFLAEAKKKENEDEKVKAEEKKVSKPVEKDLSHNFDNTDEKNPDNMIFGQIMMGYYAEMKDPKNSEKTMEELKDMVFKNLAKDPIYYTKHAQFGVKDLGYTDEAPALGEPKEAKGKFKSSGYGDLNENIEKFKSDVKAEFEKKPTTSGRSPEELKAIIDKQRKDREEKLRNVIREIIDEELEEAYQLTNINLKTVPKDREERDPQDFFTVYLKQSTEDLLKKNQHLRVLTEPKNPEVIKGVAIRSRFIAPQNLKKLPYDINPMFINFLNTANNIGGEVSLPTREGVMDKYILLNNVNVGRDGRLSFRMPNPKATPKMEGLMESVEKDLAQINKEAEHEVLQSKMEKIQSLIDKKQSQLSKLDEDEDMKSLTDDKKVKEISKDIKALEKAKAKLEKLMGKVKVKGKKKEVIDEMDTAEEAVEDIAPGYIDDANERLRAGEEIDSILSNYPNLSLTDRNHLKNYLEWQQGSDVGQSEELDAYEPY
jgi:hypothetical protein